jgi:hypothetical protein
MNNPVYKLGKTNIESQEDVLLAIENETEWLQTTEGDEIECISIENLMGILTRYFKYLNTNNGN